MEWKWIIGAILIGFGLPSFVYGAAGWDSPASKVSDLLEIIAGLISAVAGFILVWSNERKSKTQKTP
jgi:hypothetical protein